MIPIGKICAYATKRIPYASIDADNYVTTDNLLQNSEGVEVYDNIPTIDTVVEYRKGDILLSNIRPYLKKIWLADHDGGCSPDVLVIRPRNNSVLPKYVYNTLRRQQFFDYVMKDIKGMKMPRGNKDHIMRYHIPIIDAEAQKFIVEKVQEYEAIIYEAQQIMNTCSQRKKDILLGLLG